MIEGSFLGGCAAVLMTAAFLLCGYGVARLLLAKESLPVRLWMGGAMGLLLMMWLPALCALVLRFTAAAQMVGLALAAALVLGMHLLAKRAGRLPAPDPATAKLPWPMLLCVVPIALFSLYLLIHHTLRPQGGALHTGQSGYGDMSMHLGFITSLARQGTFPPEYSILPGTRMGYPFLSDSISAGLYALGAPLRLSYILPAFLAMLLCFVGYYLLMLRWLRSHAKAALAFWLFFAGGGLGFFYFFDLARQNPENFTRAFTAFYETPTNFTQPYNIRWVNPLVDMMLPQRATLFGWMALLPCLYLLQRFVFDRERRYAPLLGLIAGALPMIHTHSFLALIILSLFLFIWSALHERSFTKTLKHWWPYPVIAAALALPQLLLFTFKQASSDGFLQFNFNWGNLHDGYLWFYIKNLGITFLLALPAFLAAPRRRRAFFLCVLPIWLLAEFIQFQPNEYDNNKLLYVVYMLLCGLVAGYLVDVYRKLSTMRGRRLLMAMAVVVGTLSGGMSMAREAVSDYEVFSSAQAKAAHFIDQNLPTDALVLTGEQHVNAPAVLAGRMIFMGSPSYLYFHGVEDDARRHDQMLMLTQQGALAQLAPTYGITHVYLSEYEQAAGARGAYFAQYPIVYDQDGILIYELPH